ncbi:MAG: hypothetical protein ABI988_18465 [Nitrospirota bacterium]
MLLINRDFTAFSFSGIGFMVSDGSLTHAIDGYSEPSDHTECEQAGSLQDL